MKLPLLILFIFMAYASDAQAQSLDAYTWLTGTWKQKGNIFEKWVFNVDRTALAGTGFKISKQGDTTVLEKIVIRFEKGDFYYVADAAQNTAPVWFKIVETTPQYFLAENPEHDFPKYIRYQRIGEKKLRATVGAGKQIVTFNFTKMP
jgi:hypothetical protein